MSFTQDPKKFLSYIDNLEKELLDARKKKLETMFECSHKHSNGISALRNFRNGWAKCGICGNRFNQNSISNEDIDRSLNVLNNAINQIKITLIGNDPSDAHTIEAIGNVLQDCNDIAEFYKTSGFTRRNIKEG